MLPFRHGATSLAGHFILMRHDLLRRRHAAPPCCCRFTLPAYGMMPPMITFAMSRHADDDAIDDTPPPPLLDCSAAESRHADDSMTLPLRC